jgi:hypothetical protein
MIPQVRPAAAAAKATKTLNGKAPGAVEHDDHTEGDQRPDDDVEYLLLEPHRRKNFP